MPRRTGEQEKVLSWRRRRWTGALLLALLSTAACICNCAIDEALEAPGRGAAAGFPRPAAL